MSVHEKLAARSVKIRDGLMSGMGFGLYEAGACAAINRIVGAIEAGDLDDILGVREPTIEHTSEQARRAYGERARIDLDKADGHVLVCVPYVLRGHHGIRTVFHAPTIAAAYAALRTLPDYEAET